MENVTYIDHPLVQHKISMLRKKTTGTNEFRTLVEEIATLMGYEALRDLPLEDVEVETPIETCMTPMLAGKKLAIVPILRAGLGMVNGVLSSFRLRRSATLVSTVTKKLTSLMNISASFRTRSSRELSLSQTRCSLPAVPQLQLLISSSSTAESISNLCASSLPRKV